MNQYDEALKIATEYYIEHGDLKILEIYECEDRWVFFGGIPGMVNYGGGAIYIMKDSLVKSEFILPSRENFDMLENAKPILVSNSIEKE